jgi:integrase
MAAAGQLRSPLRACTHQALFGLLASTGMRVGEAIRLDDTDVDLTGGLITIRETKFCKTRQLPMHTSAVTALRRYTHERNHLCTVRPAASFFISTAGTRLLYTNVRTTFRGAIAIAKIATTAPTAPRMHDLRHSFAVATLLGWYRDGGDVQARLPLLSAYLGHGHPSSTYWYLQAAPELLALAASRLEQPHEVLR